jgi:WbqC-like protein family
MILGVMQPYFFPYLGYFDLIHACDRFLLFDTAQYIRHGWVNRNRILHPTHGWKYMIVPLQKHSRSTLICDVLIHEDPKWRETLIGQLDHYKKRAPFFRPTMDLVRSVISTDDSSLARMNGRGLEQVCAVLGIPFCAEYLSEMQLELDPVHGPGDWALRIAQVVGATSYVNPVGGESLFNPADFHQQGIELVLRPFNNMNYACAGYEFHAALSIVDVLMWNDPADIRHYLEKGQELASGLS